MNILLLSPEKSIHTERWASFLIKNGCRVVYASFRRGYTLPQAENHFIPAEAGPVHKILRIRQIIREGRIDVVNAHFLRNYGYYAFLSLFHPFVLTLWGSDYAVKRKLYDHVLPGLTLRFAEGIIVDNEDLAGKIKKIAGEKKVFVGGWGTDLSVFKPGSPKAEGPFTLLFTRGDLGIYNSDAVIRAAGLVRKRGYPLRLMICGGIAEPGKLSALIRQAGIEDVTEVRGGLPHGEMPALFRSADAYISLAYTDQTPVSALEALASGLPCLLSGLPSYRAAFKDCGAVMILDRDAEAVASALVKLMENRALYAEMSHEARIFAEAYADENLLMGNSLSFIRKKAG